MNKQKWGIGLQTNLLQGSTVNSQNAGSATDMSPISDALPLGSQAPTKGTIVNLPILLDIL